MEDPHDGDAPGRSWWRRLAVALAAAGTVAGIAVSVAALVDSSGKNAGDDPFYEAPDPLPTGAAARSSAARRSATRRAARRPSGYTRCSGLG